MDTKKKKSKAWIWIVGVIVLFGVAALVLGGRKRKHE